MPRSRPVTTDVRRPVAATMRTPAAPRWRLVYIYPRFFLLSPLADTGASGRPS